jgi:hypothetical protein
MHDPPEIWHQGKLKRPTVYSGASRSLKVAHPRKRLGIDQHQHFPRPVAAKSPCAHRPYNLHVARGWESKSVEAQQAEASEKPGIRRPPMTPAEAALHREVEGLRLSRRRIVQELSAQQDSRHRKMLEQALADLDQKIAVLTVDSK